MSVVLFFRADLLKASHYKTINVKGHMHGGHWVDTHAARVLVSDDHDDEKVATGHGSFYQKQAHKKLSVELDHFHAIPNEDKAGIVLKHATKLQQDASASAAVSGFKSSMLDGKVPTKSQYFAMQNAPTKVQGDVADACAAAIGVDKYEQLLMAASAKHNQPKGKPSESKTAQAVETSPQGQAQGKPTREAAKPSKIAGTDTTAEVNSSSAAILTFTGDGLESYVSHGTGHNAGKFGVSLKDTDAGEFVQSVTFYPTKDEAIKSAKAAAGLKDSSAYSVKKAPVGGFGNEGAIIHVTADFTAAEKLLGLEPGSLQGEDSTTYSVADASGQTFSIYKHGGGLSVRTSGKNKNFASAQTLAYFIEKNAPGEVGPKEGDTKTENGKTYKLLNGKWHRVGDDGFAMSSFQMGYAAYSAGIKGPASDADFVAVHGSDQTSNKTISAMSSWHKGFDLAYGHKNQADANAVVAEMKKPSTGLGNSANAVASATASVPKDGDTKPGANGSNLVFKDGRWHKYVDADESGEVPPVLVPVDDDSANHKAAVAAMEAGAFYQKEAIKKLKAEHGDAWNAMHPSKQHELAHAKYQALQGAASQAAAVSGWKKHMLAGQVPTPSEVKAMAAFDAANPHKAVVVMNDVQGVIGLDKYVQLVTQAHAKAAKAPDVPAPAKVFVTEKPAVATTAQDKPFADAFNTTAKHVTGDASLLLQDKPAYDHLAQSIANHKSHSLPAQKTFHKVAAQDWMAANPDKGAEMYEALADHKLSHLAAMIGPDVKPAVTVGAASVASPHVNEAKAKFKNNPDVNNFISMFKLHGGPIAQGHSIDEMLDPPDIAAFNKLTPDEKSDVAAAISFYGPHKLNLFMQWVSEQNAKAYANANAPTGPIPVTSNVYVNKTAGHNKFWSVSVHGNKMKTTYGKLGTQGSETTKEFASPDAAVAAANKLKGEKVAKGYTYGYTGTHKYDAPTDHNLASTPAVPTSSYAPPASKIQTMSGGWKLDPSDPSLSGAPSLTQESNGNAFYIAFTDDGMYQVGVIDPEGSPIDHEDVLHPEDAVVMMQDYLHSHGNGEAAPTEAEVQKLNPAGSPKDGDTKLGADGGTLVFKNGRWHKQGVVIPDFNALSPDKFGPIYAGIAQKLADAVAADGLAGLKKHVTFHKNGKISVTVSPSVLKNLNASAPSNFTPLKKARQDAMHKLVMDLKAAAQKAPKGKKVVFTTGSPTAPATAAPTPKAKVSAPTVKTVAGKPPITVIDGWQQTGPQKGSNPGGKFKDKQGQEWYCKFPADIDVAMNELLAAKFYQMLGVAVPNLKLVEQGGKVGIASKWVDGISKGTSAQLAKAPGAHQAFALDAWLANWDVIGLSNDNLMIGKDGAAVRVDVGGSLVYRAQGGVKGDAFGDTVPELETLRDVKTNDKSAAVFGAVKGSDMAWGLGQLNKMKPSQIEELCQKIGPGSDADKAALAKKLIARRVFILAKFGMDDQWTTVKALDPTKLPVNVSDLPKPIQFTASSKAHVNAQNTKDSEALIAFASKGNLTALKDYFYDAVDKETSAPLGKKSILDHPSKPLKEQWSGLIELLQSISTPPLPTLTLPSLGSVGELGEISDFVGFFNPLDRVETVSPEHRMHFFMALSHIDDISGLVAGTKWSFIKSGSKFVTDAKASYGKLSSVVKGYISKVQSSGSINHSWSQGKTIVEAGGSQAINALTAKIYAEANELPEGTTLIRGMSDTSSGKSMCQQLLACAPGTVIQNTDSMCASYNEGHSWGGDVQMTIRCAKGCKATLSFATGKYGGEHEITTLPGQRYVVLGTKKVHDTVHLEVLMLPPHEGYVEELGKLAALGKAIVVFFKRMM